MRLPARTAIVQLPTPLHRLDRISERLGIELWIKRDDLTGFALGGNKGRKLEYLMADILASGSEAVVTCGALQSNFIRQLAAACAVFGIRCVAVTMPLPYSAEYGMPVGPGLAETGGNVLLDELFGAELHRFPNGDWTELYAQTEEIAVRLESEGLRVYRIPIGGSSPLGGYAFFQAAQELASQGLPFDTVICPTSSGSTQAGLVYAWRSSPTRLIGMAADPEPDLMEDVLRVGSGLADLLGVESLGERHFEIKFDWAGPAYGVPDEIGRRALKVMARTEGIVLDPIYTAKAFAGLLAIAEAGELKGRVLFWHTGGVPALFSTALSMG